MTDILSNEVVVVGLYEGVKDCVGFNKTTLQNTYGVDIPGSELGNYTITLIG